ncbi:hypothetical protein BH10ACT1_BH10ACT1_18010 [soil metagenome]
MINDEKLSKVLSEFARTLITDFPIQRILDHLVERIVDIMPVTAAGVTLISEQDSPHYIAASNEEALKFETFQCELRQGPCITAFESGEPVEVPDLWASDDYPEFREMATSAGLAAVFTFPLRHGDERLGALDLYRDQPGALDPADRVAAQTLADVASAYILNARAREQAHADLDRFRHRALHDPLTGLANRRLLEDRLREAAQRPPRPSSFVAVLFADLDQFKRVNDAHGHPAGDEVLLQVARRLSEVVRPGDTLARVSGDEFVFLCQDLRSQEDGEDLVRQIRETFALPFDLVATEGSVSVGASVGMAFAGPGVEVSDQLIAEADLDMYRMKRDRLDSRAWSLGGHWPQAAQERRFEKDLRAAFAREEFTVAYQPIVELVGGKVVGTEALLRWQDQSWGPVPPQLMIEVAERSSLIDEVGTWVLERACRDRAEWTANNPQLALDLSVNVSGRQLENVSFCDEVEQILARTGTEPTALVLELTESILINSSGPAHGVLRRLDEMGVRLALDDFGTGYSSLTYLRDLPIHQIKIDRSFTSDISNRVTSKIVTSVVELAATMDLAVVAEGIETAEHYQGLVRAGCHFGQGYRYAHPMPAASLETYLNR